MSNCEVCGCADAWFTVYKGQIRDGMSGSKYGEVEECDICGVHRLKPKYTLDISAYENGAYRDLLDQPHSLVEAQYLHIAENREHLKVIGNVRGSIVDVGCGSGCLVNLLNCTGVEPDKHYRDQLRRSGKNVLKEIKEYKGRADLALVLNVIEHVDNPVKLLKQVALMSKQILICTPESDFKELDLDQELRETFYRTQHTWYFDDYSLKRCIEYAGLNCISTVRVNDTHIYLWAET